MRTAPQIMGDDPTSARSSATVDAPLKDGDTVVEYGLSSPHIVGLLLTFMIMLLTAYIRKKDVREEKKKVSEEGTCIDDDSQEWCIAMVLLIATWEIYLSTDSVNETLYTPPFFCH